VRRCLRGFGGLRETAKEMCKPRGIIIFGANGSGKTTTGREVARILGCKHMDIEDYHFEESDIPYTVARSREDCLRLMLADMEEHLFVLTAVTGDFGDVIPSFYALAVRVEAPLALRVERVKQRAHALYEERVCAGGDMYEQTEAFVEFVATRPFSKIEKWGEAVACPVICIRVVSKLPYAA